MTSCRNCGFENGVSAKFCAECGERFVGPATAPREIRRTVTVLFADVTGSTALGERLDPESLRTLMARYFAAIRRIIERHGGLVEKFIGDAVMAVFGIPLLHEDDALRAVRAAAEIRDTLADLNQELQRTRGLAIVFRTGVNTGEVVAGEGSAAPTLVTGDAVNTAARLEQAAAPGEILVGQSTYRLVRDAVVAEPTEPIEAKGKAQPVPAYRLLSVIPSAAGRSRRLDAPMVGREWEVRSLGDGLERAVLDRGAQLVTVLGAPGVGKSRLIEEFRQQNEGRATFLIGRCLSYGEGITYWPLADALRGAVAVDDDKPAESWRAGLSALLEGETQAEGIVEQVVGLMGVGGAAGGTEAFWAVRRLLEAMARDQPLVLVIEDVHWATHTFLDLVDHVADWTRDAPILLVCLARPELLDSRPGWGGGKQNATTFLVEPLDATSIDSVLAHLVGSTIAAGLGRRIATAAEGNPLFVEELVGMLIESGALLPEGDGMRLVAEPAALEVPPTIEALVAARLAQLPFGDRAALERGSVIGTQFGASEIAHLSDESELAAVRAVLVSMVRRDFLRPDAEAQLPLGADDAFRFRHQVIRDGAYAGMSKAERAQLHERYANLLAELPAEQIRALEEVIGYHLEQAALLWTALGGVPLGATDPALWAASHLGAAGQRALDRLDIPAAANLLGRASQLLPPADPQRIALLPPLANALLGLGEFDRADAAVREAIQATNDGSDPDVRVRALLERSRMAGLKGASGSEQQPDIDEAFEIAEASGDLRQLASVRNSRADLAANAGRLAEAVRELEQGVDAAKRAGDRNLEARLRTNLTWVTWFATSSAADIDRTLTENLAFSRDHGLRSMENGLLRVKAVEAARRGEIPEARRLMAEWFEIMDDLGTMHTAGVAMERGWIEAFAGEPLAREQVLREGYEQLRAIGERGVLSTVAADLADALIDLDRLDEAEALCAIAEEAGAEDDMATQVRVRLARGRLAAASGSMDKALAWAVEAVALADQGEFYDTRTASRLVLASLLLHAGHIEESRARAQEVVDLARVRGDVIFEAKARRLSDGASRKG